MRQSNRRTSENWNKKMRATSRIGMKAYDRGRDGMGEGKPRQHKKQSIIHREESYEPMYNWSVRRAQKKRKNKHKHDPSSYTHSLNAVAIDNPRPLSAVLRLLLDVDVIAASWGGVREVDNRVLAADETGSNLRGGVASGVVSTHGIPPDIGILGHEDLATRKGQDGQPKQDHPHCANQGGHDRMPYREALDAKDIAQSAERVDPADVGESQCPA